MTLRDSWRDIIVLNVYTPTEDKIDEMKDSFYEELEHIYSILSSNTKYKFC
jgi:hypothetical protein